MPKEKELTEKVFVGTVLKDPDPKHQGRYKVHIPEMMEHINAETGLWCKNHTHSGRTTMSDKGPYGSYMPLQPGTQVKVRFMNNDPNTGAIEQVASDHEVQSLPYAGTDRDDVYQVLRTPNGSLIQVNESTNDVAPDSLHIYHNGFQTTIVMDSAGVHIHTEENYDLDVDKDFDERVRGDRRILNEGNIDITTKGGVTELIELGKWIQISGNKLENVKGTYTKTVRGLAKTEYASDLNINVQGKLKITALDGIDLVSNNGIRLTNSIGDIVLQSSSGNITAQCLTQIKLVAPLVQSILPIILPGATPTINFPERAADVVAPDIVPKEVKIATRLASSSTSEGSSEGNTPDAKQLDFEISADELDLEINPPSDPRVRKQKQAAIDAKKQKLADIGGLPSTSMVRLFNDQAGQPKNDGTKSSPGKSPNEYPYFGGKPETREERLRRELANNPRRLRDVFRDFDSIDDAITDIVERELVDE